LRLLGLRIRCPPIPVSDFRNVSGESIAAIVFVIEQQRDAARRVAERRREYQRSIHAAYDLYAEQAEGSAAAYTIALASIAATQGMSIDALIELARAEIKAPGPMQGAGLDLILDEISGGRPVADAVQDATFQASLIDPEEGVDEAEPDKLGSPSLI
jgi:hypothetical protein